jgi:hypothetical protein
MTTVSMRPSLAISGHRWFMVALVLLFIALSVRYSFKVRANRSAFSRWQPQVLGLENGVDLSERYNYPNPPIMAIVLFPLAKLPPLWAALTWYYLKAGLTLLALRWVFQIVAETEIPFPPWARGLTVMLSLRPIMSDLQHGNVNLFILFLVIGALVAFVRRRDVLAGVVLALAIACKVTPALFVPYLIWKRAWRALAGCALGMTLFLWPGFLPALVLGHEENHKQLTSWYKEMVHPFLVEGKVTSEHNNQSLPGLVARLATHSPSFSTYVNDQYTPTHYDNWLDLDPAAASWIVKGCMAVFGLLILWSCRTIAATRQGWRASAEFSLILLGMLLFSERTWKHHCVTLALPFAVLCYYLACCQPSRPLAGYLVGTLAIVTLLMAATSTLQGDEVGKHSPLYDVFAKQAQVYGAYVFAYGFLAAALVVILRKSVQAQKN